MAGTPDARLREIMAAAVRHLHAFAREVNLTPEEWLAGIAFLTAVGQACTPYRQEFILLSDVLGLSRLVNVMHDAEGREAAGTETSLLGPFFREKAPEFALGDSIAVHDYRRHGDRASSARCRCRRPAGAACRRSTSGRPTPRAFTTCRRTTRRVMDMRGRFRADAEGRYHFRTVKPDRLLHPDGRAGRRRWCSGSTATASARRISTS